MKVGTKSILFGARCFFLHPWFVATAWWKLYGFPFDPRLWVAFFVHDLGYWGMPNMDGPEGESHPWTGAKIMSFLFTGSDWGRYPTPSRWGDFCLYHSRFLAKSHGIRPSQLCMTDKLAIALTPAWLYLPMTRWSGELEEYLHSARPTSKHGHMGLHTADEWAWYQGVQKWCRAWAMEHRDGRDDTWTPAQDRRI
jgi:hypothetical protein